MHATSQIFRVPTQRGPAYHILSFSGRKHWVHAKQSLCQRNKPQHFTQSYVWDPTFVHLSSGGIKEYREAQLKGQYTTEAAVGAEPVKVCANSHRAFGEGAIVRKVSQALWVTLLFSVALLRNITWRKYALTTYKAMDLMLLRHGIETCFLPSLANIKYFKSYNPHWINQG